MLDLAPLGIMLAIAAVVALIAAAILNRREGRPDPIQAVLEREPLYGKQFVERFYSELPRNVVFEVRSEFARLAGLPADFLLPGDRLAALGTAGCDVTMRGFITALVGRYAALAGGSSSASLPENMSTLDDCIRAAADACQAALRGPSAGINQTSTPDSAQARE
jgi:hypothetical protein